MFNGAPSGGLGYVGGNLSGRDTKEPSLREKLAMVRLGKGKKKKKKKPSKKS